MANQAIEGQAVRYRLINVELAMQKVSKVSYASIFKVTRTGRKNPAESASAVTQIMSDVDSTAGVAHVVVTGNLPTGYYSVETYYVGNQRFVREPDGWRKSTLTPEAAQFLFSGIADMGLASSPIWSGKSFNTLEGVPRNLIVLETTISGAEIAKAAVPPGVEAMAELGVDAAVLQFGIDRESSVINELKVRGSGTSGSGDQECDYYEEIDVAVRPRPTDYRIVLPA